MGYAYDLENRLTQTWSGSAGTPTNWGAANWGAFQWSGAATSYLDYDPLNRLRQTAEASGTKQYLYDGDALVAEYDATSGMLLRRYGETERKRSGGSLSGRTVRARMRRWSGTKAIRSPPAT